jgi:PqqD family protein of HPr-rel-A system
MPESTQVPRPIPGAQGTDLGDEYLFYDRERDRVHVLNATAREILLLCDGTRTEEQIARQFAERYDVDPATAATDAQRTLQQLYELGLLAR